MFIGNLGLVEPEMVVRRVRVAFGQLGVEPVDEPAGFRAGQGSRRDGKRIGRYGHDAEAIAPAVVASDGYPAGVTPFPAVAGTRPGILARFFGGVGLLGRGLRLVLAVPRRQLLGLVPGLIVGALFVAAFAVLIYFIDELAEAVTFFADDWSDTARNTVQILTGVAILGGALLLAVVSFTAFALWIGSPIYDRISGEVERECGGATGEVEIGWWRGFLRDLGEWLRMLLLAAGIGVLLFAGGLIPVIGQTVIPVLGVAAGGWLLAFELVGIAFTRRGQTLSQRRRALRGHRAERLGFGCAVFVCFTFIPLGALFFMPAAVAGGTLLARKALGLPAQDARAVT